MIAHVSPHHVTDGITASSCISVVIRTTQRAWGCCSSEWKLSPARSPPIPSSTWRLFALPPSSQRGGFLGQGAETSQRQSSSQEELYSSEVCGFLNRYGCCCNTSHSTCTKCFMPVLQIVAQVWRHLFYICCAYECKRWSLKVIFTNVLTISEFPVLMYHQGDTPNAISTPCFRAYYSTLVAGSLRRALLKGSFYLRETFFSLTSETIHTE